MPTPSSIASVPSDSENVLPVASGDRAGTQGQERRRLNVSVQGLTDVDIARVSTFLRLGRDRLQYDWTIVFKGEAHALLYGTDEPSTVPGLLDSPLEMRRVSDAEDLGRPTAALARPLQYEAVVDTLVEVELKCVAGTPRVDRPSRAPAAEPMPLRVTLRQGDCYRLRRWPGAELLHSDRNHMRLASFLSTRHIDINELSRLANVDLALCDEFLRTLLAAGVVDARQPSGPSSVGAHEQPLVPAVTRNTSVGTGLLSRIRSKLGLFAAQ